MSKHGLVTALVSFGLATFATAAVAADVTQERLLNAANEPQNWLMVHRDYDNSRHSPLKDINRTNVKDLKPKFIVLDRRHGRPAERCAARKKQPRWSTTASCMSPTPGAG